MVTAPAERAGAAAVADYAQQYEASYGSCTCEQEKSSGRVPRVSVRIACKRTSKSDKRRQPVTAGSGREAKSAQDVAADTAVQVDQR